MSKVGKTFNGTNSTRDEEPAIFSSNVSSATLITQTALFLYQSLSRRETRQVLFSKCLRLIDKRGRDCNFARKLSKSYDLLSRNAPL